MKTKATNSSLNIMVVEPRGTGGMIHYAYQLCTGLANAGAHVTLVTSTVYEMDNFSHNFSLRKQMKLWSTVESQETDANSGWMRNAALILYRKIRRVLRGIRLIIEWIRLIVFLIKSKPDIIQFGKIEFPFEAIFLSILKSSGLRLSQICHEFELREQGNNPLIQLSNQLYRWVYNNFSVIFFHGESNQRRFLSLFNVPKSRLYNIEHGNENLFLSKQSNEATAMSLRQRNGIEPEAQVILFFGNLMPSKGIPDLIRAFAQVYKKEKHARLIIAGNPSKFIDMDELRKLTSDLDITHEVVFDARYIPMEEVATLMELSTVVVYPYLNSTQSGALQVAYTFGKPVIATNVGGLPEVVEDGKSGFLIPPASPDELAKAMLKFFDNSQLTQTMGAYAKHLSDTRFSWDMIALKILDVYQKSKVGEASSNPS